MKDRKRGHGKEGAERRAAPPDLSELFPLEPVPEDAGTAHEFSILLKYINDHRGLDCKQYKTNYLKRRISVRMRARATPRYVDYLQLLKRDPDEYRQLLNDLTINVTEFFRDPDVYVAIRDKLLPEILEYKRGKRSNTIRIWSAGCATGEEPYSLAMLAWDCFSRQKEKDYWIARITATDLDDNSLRTAREGRYPVINVLPGDQPERYFERAGEEWRVRSDILHMVKFYKADLMNRPAHRYMDMVVCRNVLIYFEKEMQKQLLLSFHQSLRRDGFLVLGKSEAIVGTVGTQFEPYLRRERIYRKLEDPDAPVEEAARGAARSAPPRDRGAPRRGRA